MKGHSEIMTFVEQCMKIMQARIPKVHSRVVPIFTADTLTDSICDMFQ